MALLRADRIRIPVERRAVVARAAGAYRYVSQTENNWCWAACGEMLMQAHGINETQCSLASQKFKLACCPSPGAPHGCDKVAWPDQVYPPRLPTFPVDGQITETRLIQELAAGKPVQVCYRWKGSSSTHVALVIAQLAQGRYGVLDPDKKVAQATYRFQDLATAHGEGDWIMTFTF
ncbi:MAG: hypothetical protein PGN23_07255 [Sphingomonas adhaesiva]|uniref:papain-like cysteine protease family protein n=1 Tax=Sphingomonas adhaesiva TaxID=28212 RepID=UPI002FF4B71D